MAEMNKDRFEKFLSVVEEDLYYTCPIIDANAANEDLPFCSLEYCLTHTAADCWRKWVEEIREEIE